MKIVNSRGRVLLTVTACRRYVHRDGSEARTVYDYSGPGMGGCNVDLTSLHRTIAALKLDCPSARAVGLLPNPTLPFEVVAYD